MGRVAPPPYTPALLGYRSGVWRQCGNVGFLKGGNVVLDLLVLDFVWELFPAIYLKRFMPKMLLVVLNSGLLIGIWGTGDLVDFVCGP